MAVTAEGARLTQLQRRLQLRVLRAAIADLGRLWRVVDVTDLRGTLPMFLDAAPTVVQRRYAEAVRVAVRSYRALRRAEIGEGVVPDVPAPGAPDQATIRRSLSGASATGILNARREGLPVSAALERGRRKMGGAATSLVMAGGRRTTLTLAAADGRSARWARITSADPCDFCSDLAGRGAVFAAETGDFQAHDHCSCTAEPQFI